MGCRVIQTNWKLSGNWVVTDHDKSRAKSFYQKIINSGYDIPENEITNSKAIDIRYDLTRRPFQGQAPFITNFIFENNSKFINENISLFYLYSRFLQLHRQQAMIYDIC